MNRRTFVTSAAIAGASSTTLLKGADRTHKKQGYLELIRFVVRNRSSIRPLEKYLGDTVIPGLNKLGCSPVGVFKPNTVPMVQTYICLSPIQTSNLSRAPGKS